MQITTNWERKGRKEGRLEGKITIILRLLNRKVGNLPDEIATQIESLDSSQLDFLTESLLEFETLDDFNGWLNCL